ncbi:radical SAM protein, partial [Thermodesulfobacteriota bacterium]
RCTNPPHFRQNEGACYADCLLQVHRSTSRLCSIGDPFRDSSHVPFDPIPLHGKGELSTGQWLNIIEQLGDLGCIQINITGGEPLMRRDIGVIIENVHLHGMRVSLNTNGHLVEQNLNVVSMVDQLTLSLDGPPKVHDGIRGSGSHDIVLNAARLARECRIPITFYTVLTCDNLDHLDYILSTARRLEGRVVFQPGTTGKLYGCIHNPKAPDIAAYREAIDHIIRRSRQAEPIGNSIAGLRYLRNWPDPAPIACLGHRLFCRVEADGNLRICGLENVDNRISVVSLGLEEAIKRLPKPDCAACWSAARVEFHMLVSGRPSAIRNYLRRGV